MVCLERPPLVITVVHRETPDLNLTSQQEFSKNNFETADTSVMRHQLLLKMIQDLYLNTVKLPIEEFQQFKRIMAVTQTLMCVEHQLDHISHLQTRLLMQINLNKINPQQPKQQSQKNKVWRSGNSKKDKWGGSEHGTSTVTPQSNQTNKRAKFNRNRRQRYFCRQEKKKQPIMATRICSTDQTKILSKSSTI